MARLRLRLPAAALAACAAIVTLAASAARADAPLQLTTTKLTGIDGSGAEPRLTIGPDDVRWVETNAGRQGGTAVVFSSVDGGQTWQRTPADPAGQVQPTIDVDIVAMRTRRILASELDTAGLNFPAAVTDDNGRSWTQSHGSNQLADQDRQWFAVGPDDPTTGKPTVYLLYHNLASGFAQHNMWVAKSTDGGLTFGAPVPVA